jgi:hypothetical protein
LGAQYAHSQDQRARVGGARLAAADRWMGGRARSISRLRPQARPLAMPACSSGVGRACLRSFAAGARGPRHLRPCRVVLAHLRAGPSDAVTRHPSHAHIWRHRGRARWRR